MTKATGSGSAQLVPASDFNERIRRLLSEKTDPFEGVTSRPVKKPWTRPTKQT